MNLKQIMKRMQSPWRLYLLFVNNKYQEPSKPTQSGDVIKEHASIEEAPVQLNQQSLDIMNATNTKFDERRDLLVLPSNMKDEDLSPQARAIVKHLTTNNKVIRLKFITKPATVRV